MADETKNQDADAVQAQSTGGQSVKALATGGVLTSPTTGVGILLSVAATGDSGSTPLGFLKDDCEFSGWEVNVVELMLLASPNVTKLPGRINYGDFSGSLYAVPGDFGTQKALAMFQGRKQGSFTLTLVDGSGATTGTTLTWTGFFSGFGFGNFTGEDAPEIPFTIACNAVTLNLGS